MVAVLNTMHMAMESAAHRQDAVRSEILATVATEETQITLQLEMQSVELLDASLIQTPTHVILVSFIIKFLTTYFNVNLFLKLMAQALETQDAVQKVAAQTPTATHVTTVKCKIIFSLQSDN